VFFDSRGTLLGPQKRAVSTESNPVGWDDRTFQECSSRALASWKAEIGFREEPIRVKPFFLKEYRIGIEEFPLDLADYLSNPSKYPPEDQIEFLKDVESWKREGSFVFFWSESYHLDKNGEPL
jgi:hypothetical protein